MISNYLVLTAAPDDHAFVLHKLSFVPSFYKIVKGEPRASNFPADVTHSVDPDYPNDMLLVDVFRSPNLVFLISSRLKQFLEQRKLKNVEFLPVAILDHKNNVAGSYFILHPVFPVDCLDLDASHAKLDPADKSYVYEIQEIVVKPENIDPELAVFKIKRLFEQIIIRKDLAAAMDAQGFTGYCWTEFSDFHRP